MARVPEIGFALQRGFHGCVNAATGAVFVLFGGTIAVCARCLGIYLGAAVGLVVCTSRQVAWRWLLVAVAMNVADWIAELAGMHGNWMVARLALGFTGGALYW